MEQHGLGISVKGQSLADQLWAMARDGKSLQEIGLYLFSQEPTLLDDAPAEDPARVLMEFAVILMTTSLGICFLDYDPA